MDEIHNKTDREVLVEIHTVVRGILKKEDEIQQWQKEHQKQDDRRFAAQGAKVNVVYVGIAAIIMLLGWIKFSIAG